ncbi:putative LPXTG-motif cell wall anchor domain protein [Aspergillus candidus]|uniref:LPXTG-motif cell wall anchor domain protein n=1 Tax=Aspergillus candidus TaxID=41067 RepID=A0A2I2EXW4_ASPCN|nr:hypothetical protein BDW47DRAFT_6588 [Aspergillus candidus]PLB33212.1 hypothetical protein BDW47DRAFT_6588 [Aspergillus candidus]
MGVDPRDTARAAALTTTTNGDFFLSSTPALASPRLPSSPSHRRPSSPPSASTNNDFFPRVPQSRFSFEYGSPLRKQASVSHARSTIATPSGPDSNQSPTTNTTTTDSTTTATPQRSSLYGRHRRSVPNLSYARTPTTDFDSLPPSPRGTQEPESDPDRAPPPDSRPTVRVLSPNATKRRKQSFYASQTPDVKRRMPSSTLSYSQGRPQAGDRAVNGFDKYGSQDGNVTPIADDTRSKNDDIFLNIARTDTERRDSIGRSDFRRSRFRMSGSSLRSPTSSHVNISEQTPSPEQGRINSYESPLHSQTISSQIPLGTLSNSYSASAHPLDDHPRAHPSFGSRSTIGLPRSRLSRANADASPDFSDLNVDRRGSLQDARGYRNTTLSTIRSSRQASGSEATERPRFESDRSRHEGTESTLSTTAPSTVWDELEDLKSRIKKLEVTGKLPPSSQEAISSFSGDRPRTATTTVTTVSSPPRPGRKASAPSADLESPAVPNPVHPILQSALSKSKAVIHKPVFRALEATVTDALSLSTLLSSGKTASGGVPVANGCGSSDRYARRKADSVCRGLTELCLALSDEQIRQQQETSDDEHTLTLRTNGASKGPDEGTSTPTTSFSRSTSQEPESIVRRQSTHRMTSRLESRRPSLANDSNGPSAESSPNIQNQDTLTDGKQAQSPKPVPASRLSRLSTSLRTRRLRTEDDSNDPASPHARSISRSMTDIGNPPPSPREMPPRQGLSHRYTTSQSFPASQQEKTPRFSALSQPSQLSQPRTPTIQTNLPRRRSLITPSNYTPATPRSNIQAGSRRYAYASATPSTVGDDAPMSPQQEQSQTRIVAPSSKIASSYTPITQNRLRTNSLGARKFGIRPTRPVAGANNVTRSFDDSLD